jgi:hypothetical protein
MNSITTQPNTATSNPISQARASILSAQRLVLATEGRTLDFETADEINRKLLASINALTSEDEPDFTDEEWLELEMRLSRDHDDTQFWTLGGTR